MGWQSERMPYSEKNKCCIVGFCFSLVFILGSLFSVILSLTVGSGIEGFLLIISIVCGIVALIISIVGIVQAGRNQEAGAGLGIAGLVISIVGEIIVVLVILLLGAVLASLLMFGGNGYNGEIVKMGAYELQLNDFMKKADSAMVRYWYWDGNLENTIIEIPDQYSDGIKIQSIGKRRGPESEFFQVKIADGVDELITTGVLKDCSYYVPIKENPEAWGLEEGTEIHFEDLVFTVKIGKNIDRDVIASRSHFLFRNEDGSITYYIVDYRFECDPANPEYFSKDGKLYYKESGKEADTSSPRKTVK